MRQRSWRTLRVGLVIGICLFAADGLMGQGVPKGMGEQLLPPLVPPMEEAATTVSLPATEQPATGGYSAGKVGEATFQIDKDTGSLIVLTDDQTNEHIQKILENLDQPIPQVLIKVLFLEVTHGNDLDLGVEGTFFTGHEPKPAQYDSTGKLIGPGTLDQQGNPMAPGQIDWRDTLKTAFGVAAETRGGFYRYLSDDADVTLRALATVAKLNVLSRPSILARNNEQAYIQIGESVPVVESVRYVTGTNEPINTVTYRDTGIILQVTPHITAEGLVEMIIDGNTGISSLNKSTPLQIATNVFAYPITERLVNTKVIVPDGMTVVIGGLMTDNQTQTITKIPILGDIPWLGTVFRRTVTSKEKTELLIFLTPHVVAKTPGLKTLSVAETKKMELAPQVFTEKGSGNYLDNWQAYIRQPKPEKQIPGFWRRTLTQIRSAVEIFH